MNLTEIAQSRYATKKFDPSKRLSDEQFAQIKSLLQLSPSSVNSQPWHFVIADSVEGKSRLAKATEGSYSANHPKIMDASHVVLFCAKTEISDAYLAHITDQEDQDGRFPNNPDAKAMALKVREFYADLHRKERHDTACWLQSQVYLNIGNLLMGAGALGIDAVPIEGVDPDVMNRQFDLPAKGFTAVAVVALGFHAEDDFNAKLPKSRLPEDEIFTFL